jgi:hypothetical protein
MICPKHGASCPNRLIVTRRVRDPLTGGWRYPTNAKVFVFCVPHKTVAAPGAKPVSVERVKRTRAARGRATAKRGTSK